MGADEIARLEKKLAELEAEIAQRKRDEEIQSVLLNISQSVTKSESLKELLRSIHVELGRLMETVNFYVALYDEADDTYTFPYEVDEAEEGESYTPQQLKKSLTDYVRRTGQAILIDESEHKRLIEDGEVDLVGTPSPSWMGAPLKVGQQVMGVVVLQSYNEGSLYTHNDLELFNYVADSIALGVERKRAEVELKQKMDVIQKQQESILELSTPVIKIWDQVLVIPLIGVLDSRRGQHLTEELLSSLASTQARTAIIDITGVPTVDSAVANHLVKTIESVKLLGANCVITGIRPEVAQTIIHLGIDITGLETRATLAEGLKWTFRRIGYKKGTTYA